MHGDAFFLHCYNGDKEGWIIVDGGTSGNARLNPFVREIEQLPSKDLMVLTHIDDDHLGGIRAYVKKHQNDETFPIKKLWVNCARQIDFLDSNNLSTNHASNLADVLAKIEGVKWKDYITEGYVDEDIDFAEIILLNPEVEKLKRFIPFYEHEAAKKKPESGKLLKATNDNRPQEDYKIELKDLAAREKKKPSEADFSEFANMVSLSFIVRCDGMSGLMLGDSFPEQIIGALKRKGYSKENKLKVDFMKVAHHGSRNNISNELLDMIDCTHYLIPTNGGASACHPDREAMANILCHEGRSGETIHLYFNYKLGHIEERKGFKLFRKDDEKNYNFVIHEPKAEWEASAYRIAFD
jgi:beta-lactamase superfamily II metal-dependent hydrolase